MMALTRRTQLGFFIEFYREYMNKLKLNSYFPLGIAVSNTMTVK